MILDIERNGSRYAIGSSAFATGACLRPPTALLSTSTADSSPHPPDATDPRSPLSRTDTAQRSRPATEAASLADSLQIVGIPRRIRLDGEAPRLGAITGDIVPDVAYVQGLSDGGGHWPLHVAAVG
jgi:hypothetical protein